MNLANRNNEGKVRLGLISPIAEVELGKVLTKGAEEYEPYNWCKGLKWTECIDSLKRHLNSFQQGIDRDKQTGELHMAHIMANAMFLIEYYYTHKELDDRPKHYTNNKD